MKKHILLLLFTLNMSLVAFGQQNGFIAWTNAVNSDKIAWNHVTEQDLLGLGKQKLLSFSNAQYNFNDHLFPMYSQIAQLPLNSSSAEAQLFDMKFEPANELEKNVINGYSQQNKNAIGTEITPKVTVSFFKKHPLAYIQFIPVRKNNVTGNFEKLVSFSVQINPIKNPSQTNPLVPFRKYASNSVLATGKWFKLTVENDGVYKIDFSF